MAAKDSTTANLLYQTKASIKNADTLSINDKIVRTNHTILTDSLLQNIKTIDELLALPNADTAILYPQKRVFTTGLRVENNIYSNYLSTYYQQRNSRIADAEQYNDAVPFTQATYERNENIINRIYLSTVARGIYTFTSAQKTAIDAIADACPIMSGLCVFRARSLRKLYVPNATYNDVELCQHVGISYRIKPKAEVVITKPIYKVYPNPANDYLTIEIINSSVSNSFISLTDILGRIVYTQKINTNSHQIDVNSIPVGMYHLKIFSEEDSSNFIQKVIITH
jgi:hypothetical protein